MLKKVEKELEDKVKKFFGETAPAEWKASFEFTPDGLSKEYTDCFRMDPEDEQGKDKCKDFTYKKSLEVTLFSFSEAEGIMPTTPSYLVSPPNKKFIKDSFEDESKAKNVYAQLSVDMDKEPGGIVLKNSKADFTNPQGFYYRVPVHAKATLMQKASPAESLTAPKSITIPQWGAVMALPQKAGTGWSKSSYQFDLYRDSGGIKTMTVTSEPPSVESIGTLGAAVTAIQDAKRARKEAKLASEAAAQEKLENAEYERLKRESEMSGFEKAIMENQKAMDEMMNPVPDTG